MPAKKAAAKQKPQHTAGDAEKNPGGGGFSVVKLSVFTVAVGLGIILPLWIRAGQVDPEFPTLEVEAAHLGHITDRFVCSDVKTAKRVETKPAKPIDAKNQIIRTETTEVKAQSDRTTCLATEPKETKDKGVPSEVYTEGTRRYNTGRYARPVADMNAPKDITGAQYLTQWKQFAWNAVTDGQWWLGLAMLDFGYNGGAAVVAFNHKTGQSFHRQIELPLVLNKFFGPKWFSATKSLDEGKISSTNGCVTMSEMLDTTFLQTCAIRKENGAVVRNVTISLHIYDDLNPKLEPVFLHAEWEYTVSTPKDGPDTMNVVFPIGNRRSSLVSKGGGIPASTKGGKGPVKFTLAGVSHEMKTQADGGPSLAMFDYTRGLLRRVTIWKWLSLSVPVTRLVLDDLGPKAVESSHIRKGYGLQVSVGTYDVKNVSVESSVWVDGTLTPFEFDDVTYTQLDMSKPAYASDWRVTGGMGALDLHFSPSPIEGARWIGDFHYGILDGDLHHMWGTFTGQLPVPLKRDDGWIEYRSVSIKSGGIPGVLEDHYAVW